MAVCKYCKSKNAELNVNLNRFCDFDCAVNYAKSAQERKKKAEANKRIADAKKRDRAIKERLKTRGEWLRECQTLFNRFIRLRDAGIPCISCGHPDDGSRQRHASHYKSVGGNPELRFNEDNCHSSCSICNNYLSGNLVPYRAALIKKIGLEKVEWLESKHEPLKLTIEEIKELKKVYQDKCRVLTGLIS